MRAPATSPVRGRRLATAVFVLAAAWLPAQERGAGRAPARPPAVPPPVVEAGKRSGDFRIETRVVPPAGAQLLELWVATPRNDDYQSVPAVSAPTPRGAVLTQRQDPDSGNTYLYLRMENPTGPVAFDASWTFQRREQARGRFRRGIRGIRAEPSGPFVHELAASKLVPVTGRIKARALALAPADSDPLNAARAIYDDVVRSLEYSAAGDGAGKGDALWAADAGHGDSTDFASLFVGLARARGILARFLMGFRLPGIGAGPEAPIRESTAWAEFLVPDLGWIPVDPAEGRQRPENRQACFGNLDENRIVFTNGRDLTLVPPSKAGPHNLFIYPYAEIDGAPAPVSHRLVFKEK